MRRADFDVTLTFEDGSEGRYSVTKIHTSADLVLRHLPYAIELMVAEDPPFTSHERGDLATILERSKA